MSTSLPHVAHEHHERIVSHVDRMPALGDLIGTPATDEVRAQLGELVAFLKGTLLPHMEAAERALYPELERLLQNRHSMTPMRHEHDRMRALVDELGQLQGHIGVRPPTINQNVALRRAVFTLYALLKIHLGEEEHYLHIVEHGVTDDAAGVLAAAMEHPVVGEP